jgi:UDP-3-O-[3-hydroxymyristoyl] N-acetylglucosamine deacetylase
MEQTTLGGTVALNGIGVHSGRPVELTLHPAPAGTGIVFQRLADGAPVRSVAAHVSAVGPTELCTVLGHDERGAVSTVEHLLAALRGLAVDNVRVVVDGPEVPILDGSAEPFVAAIEDVGILPLAAERRCLKVLKPVRVEQGRAWGELRPAARGFRLEVEIDFPVATIGRQSVALDVTPASFRRELMSARTFGFLKDVEKLLNLGFARGASLDNTVVLDGDRVLNAEGLRHPQEFVRHKALDALGDLALAGLPITGCYRSFCGGHKLNAAVVRALLDDPTAWTVETEMRRRGATAGIMVGLQPALAPDLV